MAARPSVKLGDEKCPAGCRPLHDVVTLAASILPSSPARVATLRKMEETRVPGINGECTVILCGLFS